jgi:hypothetical protein
MTAVNGNRRVEYAAIAHVAAAERLARAIVVALATCEEVGVGLSDVQKTAVIEAMLLEFDGFEAHLRSLDRVGQMLRELGEP